MNTDNTDATHRVFLWIIAILYTSSAIGNYFGLLLTYDLSTPKLNQVVGLAGVVGYAIGLVNGRTWERHEQARRAK